MVRIIVLTLALTSIGGFVLGWVVFTPRSDNAKPIQEPTADLAEVTHHFPLLTADLNCDRETPAIAIDERGGIFLAWASQTAELERTLWLTQSSDGGTTFAPPVAFRKVGIHRNVRKMNGKERVFTSNVLPRLLAHRSGLYLGWVEAHGDRVEFLLAQSMDGGKTFSEPSAVHSAEAGRPGYTALAMDGGGAIVAAWLDGRNKSQQPYCSVSPSPGKPFLPEKLVYKNTDDKGICPCCDLSAGRSAAGDTFVAFRNADSGYRDIWIARSGPHADAGFEPAVPLTSDHWKFDGCPHDGPSLALTEDRAHVVWMDAHTGKRRVYFANSPTKSLQFSPQELSPNDPGEQGHPKVLADGNGMLHLVWDGSLQDDAPPEKSEAGHQHQHKMSLYGSGRAIAYTRSPDGTNFAPARLIAPRENVFQIQPSLAVDKAGVVHAVWNELSTQGKSVAYARLAAYVPPCCRK